MKPQDLDVLREACPDPETMSRLDPLVAGAELSQWFQQVDDSPFSLADWIEALLAFDGWLSTKGIAERPVESMIGYIHCCTLTMAETLSPPNLASLTREMLDQHGFDATAEVKTDS